MPGERSTMPPVRLPSDAQLAREALAAPLFSRAVRLARWAGPRTRVGVGGELLDRGLREAVAFLGLGEDESAVADTGDAWRLAVDTGLVEIREDGEGPGGEGRSLAAENGAAGAGAGAGAVRAGEAEQLDAAVGTAGPGEESALITSGSPRDILEIWLGGLDVVLADVVAPGFEDLVGSITEGEDDLDLGIDLDELEWDVEEEAEFLDGVLGNLYLLTVLEDGATASERAVPLPALAASMIVPDDMDDPTDDVLEEVSEAMMRLDDQFRQLAAIGLVEYRPVDEELREEFDEDGRDDRLDAATAPEVPGGGAAAAAGGNLAGSEGEDTSRYGMVRLTTLGLYGVRARMLDAGVDAPALGDLCDQSAGVLLDRVHGYPETAARAEVEKWLEGREPATAARELLAAGRGDDEGAPLRRLGCQQALSLIGWEAEPALREVLEDRRLGGLARVWLAEHGAAQVPEPPEEMVFWLTLDTVAAQLGAQGGSAELEELVLGLVEGHSGFFDAVWRVDHPATAEVLEAMGRLHPDRAVAKNARKAAFKARSRRSGADGPRS